jgi:hypothetical protein
MRESIPFSEDRRRIPGELAEHTIADANDLASFTLEERARMIEAACASAMDILRAREKMGLPPVEPEPWPVSTLEFLRRHAPSGKRSASIDSY